jgi:hypothetical protein
LREPFASYDVKNEGKNNVRKREKMERKRGKQKKKGSVRQKVNDKTQLK